MEPVIDCYVDCENPDLLYTLLRRTLTSIIHHCKTAEQFSPIADILVARFSTAISQSPSNDTQVERLRRMSQLISVVCSVRQGSRLTREFLHPFLTSPCYYHFVCNSISTVPTGVCSALHSHFPFNRDRSPQLFDRSPYRWGHVRRDERRTSIHHRSSQSTQVWYFASRCSRRVVLGGMETCCATCLA